jgi:hypothetical protein
MKQEYGVSAVATGQHIVAMTGSSLLMLEKML